MVIKRHAYPIKNRHHRFFPSPAHATIAGFLGAILIGTVLLMLPIASRGQSLAFIDALFTATSATCVTGLVVVDTGSFFSGFGQMTILVLIQAGGLGIMTLSTLFILMAGKRVGLAGRTQVEDTFTHSGARSIASFLKEIILFTLGIEALGALGLFFRFLPDRPLLESLYFAVFHSVSAFCNAGFALFADNFIGYREDWTVNLILAVLIITGGIGFLVISELRERFGFRATPQRRVRMSLHSKIVLTTTGLLLAVGTLGILVMEWHTTLSTFSLPGRILGAFFQSVTARTAGFNTLPVDHMANETLFFMVMLMLIGASPGSCGGGIKTTTATTLAVLGASRLRGDKFPQVFCRRIPESSVAKAVSVAMVSLLVIAAGTMLLLMTELGEVSHLQSRGKFLELFFEVVSAFGTVGLSMGATGTLSATGKLIITLIMFVGRLGPLVIALAISRRKTATYYYAEESIMVG